MDRRSLVAVVLSILVIVVFQMFLIPKPEPPSPGAGTDSTGTGTPSLGNPSGTSDVSPAPGTAGSESAPAFNSTETEEHEVRVDTDLYEAVFSNRGGRLLSWRLKSFRDPVGQWVQLVPPTDPEFGLTVRTETGALHLGNTLFTAVEGPAPDGGRRIRFEARAGTARVIQEYVLPAQGYLIDLNVYVEDLPDAESYLLGWVGGMPRAERSMKTYQTGHMAMVLKGKNKEKFMPRSFRKEHEKEVEGNILWVGVRNKYFTAVVIPPESSASRVRITGNAEPPGVGAELVMPVVGGSVRHAFKLYLGPLDYDLLKHEGYHLDAAVDLGYKIFRPVAQLLQAVMVWMHRFIPNYGVVILIISVLTKVMFYPLTRSSLKSMRAMQRVQPEMNALREKYKKDNQRLQQEMMALYKREGVNPVGGCLPIFVQMPVFIALYQVLANSIALRSAPFFGWIHDLSTPDTLATVSGFDIHVLPIVLFGFTVLQQVWTPVGDPRQKMMGYMMPLVTLFIFYGFPAGLNLYWTVNSMVTVAQQWVIHREEPGTRPAPAKA